MPPAGGKVKQSRYNVPNLERGLRILEHLLEHPEGLPQSQIALDLGYAKSSVFRITATMMELGYLTRDEKTKALTLTGKLLAMGNRSLAEKDLMATSIDIMGSLRDEARETVLIGSLVEREVVVLGQVLGTHPFKFSVDIGSRLPLHASAPAKAMLAWLPAPERERLVGEIEFVRHTGRTITNAAAFRRELGRVFQDGYALDRGEQLTGIRCVAAAIFNRHGYPIAALWITGPTERLTERELPRIGASVVRHARMISERLGHVLLNAEQD